MNVCLAVLQLQQIQQNSDGLTGKAAFLRHDLEGYLWKEEECIQKSEGTLGFFLPPVGTV